MKKMRRVSAVLLGVILLFSATGIVTAQELFIPQDIATDIAGAHVIKIADLEQDQDLEIIVAGSEEDRLYWWANDAEGNFTQHVIMDDFDSINDFVVYDVDGDGDQDIIVAGGDAYLLENNGARNPEFTVTQLFLATPLIRGIDVADIDDDGDFDIVTGGHDIGSRFGVLAWQENLGDNTFNAHTVNDTFKMGESVFITDFNIDGNLDIVAGSNDSLGVWWWENDGTQDFVNNGTMISTGILHTPAVYPVDIDNDNDMDVLLARSGQGAVRRAVEILINDGDMGFTLFKSDASTSTGKP